MTARIAAAFVLVSLGSLVDVAAQAAFVQGGIGTDIRRFSAEQGQAVFDGSGSTVWLAAGGFVTPRWTAGIELDFGERLTETRSVTVPIGGVPSTIRTSFSLERRTVSALGGFHTPREHRVRLGCYAGLAFSTVTREIVLDAPGPALPPPEPSLLTDRTGELTGFSIRPAGGVRVVF